MATLTWDHVSAWRLAQHHLVQPATAGTLREVVSAICGLHAQIMSAAEVALWVRMPDVRPDQLQAALWDDRILVKTWLMRGTLHLIPAADLPLYVAARSAHTIRRPPSYFTYHGVTPAELEAITAGVRSLLSDVPMTREQLADAVAGQTRNPRLREVLRSGWGALLKPSAFQGDLCFGPNQGQNVTFVSPRQWLGNWQAIDPEAALREVARRYLSAYGPATPDDFARWWGFAPARAKRLFRALGDEVTVVDVEGRQAWALTRMLPQMAKVEAQPTVNMLPAFDPYTIALYRHPSILLEQHKARVSRPQGWISPVVLANGRIAGVWDYTRQRDVTKVRIMLFNPLPAEIRQHIEAAAQRLGQFLGTRSELVYE